MLFHDEIKEKGTTMAFKDLPVEAKKALIFYMASDGEAWSEAIGDNPLKTDDDWDDAIREATYAYGDISYIYYDMPVDTFKDLVMQTPSDFAGCFDSFEQYHEWYISGTKIPEHPEAARWPALAWDDEEGLIDGWHRTHSYIKAGHKTLPFII